MQGSGESSLYLCDDLSGLIQQDFIDQLDALSTACIRNQFHVWWHTNVGGLTFVPANIFYY
jgi:hypothetical protein